MRSPIRSKYFAMVETLFAQQRDWVVQKPLQPLLSIAKQAGFSEQSFNDCLKNQKVLNGIEQTRTRAAEKFNVKSTPTFFINGKIVRGAMTMDEVDKQLAPYLKADKGFFFRTDPGGYGGDPWRPPQPWKGSDNVLFLLRNQPARIHSPPRCGTPRPTCGPRAAHDSLRLCA